MAGYATPAWTNDAAPAISASNLIAMGQGIEIAEHPYGVCNTSSSTTAKTVTVDFSGTLALFTGLTIRIKFMNGNSATAPTLNVNSTGATPITIVSGIAVGYIEPGETLELVYDGAYSEWRVINGLDRQKILWFTNIPVTDANPSAEIARVDDARITAQFVLIGIKFGTAGAIKSHLSWNTSSGHFTLSGVCTEATTASILLAQYMR